MNELKPCPFCGRAVEIRQISTGHSSDGTYIAKFSVGCGQCDISFVRESKFKLIGGEIKYIYNGYETVKNLWNKRATND